MFTPIFIPQPEPSGPPPSLITQVLMVIYVPIWFGVACWLLDYALGGPSHWIVRWWAFPLVGFVFAGVFIMTLLSIGMTLVLIEAVVNRKRPR